MAKMTTAKITEATITTKAELWSCDHVGQLTFFVSSLYDSFRYVVILLIFIYLPVQANGSFARTAC